MRFDAGEGARGPEGLDPDALLFLLDLVDRVLIVPAQPPGALHADLAKATETGGYGRETAWIALVQREAADTPPGKADEKAGPPRRNVCGWAERTHKGKLPLLIVGVDAVKDAIYARLRLTEPGPGATHCPRQLTAERAVTRFARGRPMRL